LALARRVAADLASRGWSLEAIMNDHGSEFAGQFGPTLQELGVEHPRIVAGPAQTNGSVKRVVNDG